jgi:hypothetical protein
MNLGKWLYNQRKAKENPGYSHMKLNTERIGRLDEIGMVWAADDAWEKRYLLAKRYYEAHGDLNIPQNYVVNDNIWLGKWLYLQRQTGRGNIPGEKLTEEQVRKLDAIGMKWTSLAEEAWEANYEAALEYYRRHGNLEVPNKYKTDEGRSLGQWLYNQRRYRLSKTYRVLTSDRIERLDAIGMDWRMPDRVREDDTRSA